jgi:hypothetical protein
MWLLKFHVPSVRIWLTALCEYTHKWRVSKPVNHFMFQSCQTFASHVPVLFEVHCVYIVENNYLVHLLGNTFGCLASLNYIRYGTDSLQKGGAYYSAASFYLMVVLFWLLASISVHGSVHQRWQQWIKNQPDTQ